MQLLCHCSKASQLNGRTYLKTQAVVERTSECSDPVEVEMGSAHELVLTAYVSQCSSVSEQAILIVEHTLEYSASRSWIDIPITLLPPQ